MLPGGMRRKEGTIGGRPTGKSIYFFGHNQRAQRTERENLAGSKLYLLPSMQFGSHG